MRNNKKPMSDEEYHRTLRILRAQSPYQGPDPFDSTAEGLRRRHVYNKLYYDELKSHGFAYHTALEASEDEE